MKSILVRNKTLVSLIKTCRPRQWTKNLLIFAATLFTFEFSLNTWFSTFIVFICFCLISSSVYIINDIIDINSDRKHPIKSKRPIPSGQISIKSASILSIFLIISSCFISYSINPYVTATLISYLIIQIFYCIGLKKQPILDIFCIALGFICRAIAGLFASNSIASHWFILTIGLLALFLAVEKRKAELRISIQTGVTTRKVLNRYSLPLLQRLESLISSSSFMAYTLWSSGPSLNGAPSSWMLISVPFVLVGIFRYQLLSDPSDQERRKSKNSYISSEMPEEILLRDRGIQLSILGWLVTILGVGIGSNLGLII
tara:strand:- start:369 stop:1313 length:945 start_codon:yes stop_codon:yes gene_type:complete